PARPLRGLGPPRRARRAGRRPAMTACPGWCSSTEPHQVHHTAPVIIPVTDHEGCRAKFAVDLSLISDGTTPKVNVVYLGETQAHDKQWHWLLPEAADQAELLKRSGAVALAAAVSGCVATWHDDRIVNPVTLHVEHRAAEAVAS